jgi:hypothetical protein
MENGSTVSNIVSEGPGGEGDLYLTYRFTWVHAELEEGDIEGLNEERKRKVELARKTVEGTIGKMREMAGKGEVE